MRRRIGDSVPAASSNTIQCPACGKLGVTTHGPATMPADWSAFWNGTEMERVCSSECVIARRKRAPIPEVKPSAVDAVVESLRKVTGNHAGVVPCSCRACEALRAYDVEIREGQAVALQGEAYHGISARVGVRILRAKGEPLQASGSSFPDALRRAARRLEEEAALGPLETTEPLRMAFRALLAARSELHSLWAFSHAPEPNRVLLDLIAQASRAISIELAAASSDGDAEDVDG